MSILCLFTLMSTSVCAEGSAYEESICNEGSICESDSAFYRQSEGTQVFYRAFTLLGENILHIL